MLTVTKLITSVNRTVLPNKTNKYIVIHYTGNKTDTAKANANYFKSVNRSSSAHYFVDDTSIYQVVEDKDSAWAVGKNYGKDNLFGIVKNNNSISIEMCSKDGKITDKTFQNTLDLTKSLMAKYSISAGNVYRHYDVCSKKCPGWTGWLPPEERLWIKFKDGLNGKTTAAVKQPAAVRPEDVKMTTIKKGSKNKAVKVWQAIIGAAVDGDFGKNTDTATRAFQKNHKLSVDGIVGANTWKAGLESV